MKFTQVCVLLVGLLGLTAAQSRISFYKNYVNKNEKRCMIELVKEHGYQIEEHTVTTEDGYKLTTFRIPPGEHCANQPAKKPILFLHGLLSSSFDFISGGPKKSLAYTLSDNCYDIWLANSRGNGVSMKHVNLTTSNPEFWDFSWHEMGVFDIPAAIDYVLKESNATSLHIIGHSQGTTEFFVFASEHPGYHSKIASMHALAPVVFFKHFSHLFVKFAAQFYEVLEVFLRSIGMHDLSLICEILRGFGTTYCIEEKYPTISDACSVLFYLISGGDIVETNTTALFGAFLEHFPSGASIKQFYHYAQQINSQNFRQYDYGIYKNQDVYGSMFPPEYNISAINAPIALYYSLNDYLSPVEDVKTLVKKLPNVTEIYEVPFPQFTHYDFLVAIDAPLLLWNRIVEMIEKFN